MDFGQGTVRPQVRRSRRTDEIEWRTFKKGLQTQVRNPSYLEYQLGRFSLHQITTTGQHKPGLTMRKPGRC